MQPSQDWLSQFDQRYRVLLDSKSSGAKRGLVEGHCQRWQGFRIMFELLLARREQGHRVVETGTLRNPGNWKDGQSARLFTEFAEHYHGDVRSVDIDTAACQSARAAIPSTRFTVTCSDSVTYLESLDDLASVNLFYLDSWDVKWEDDRDSAEHHLREFQVIEPCLAPGTVVAIDDNSRFLADQQRTGKGRRIVEYLAEKDCLPIYDRYQIIYQF